MCVIFRAVINYHFLLNGALRLLGLGKCDGHMKSMYLCGDWMTVLAAFSDVHCVK